MIIKPFGEHLEFEKHGTRAILTAFLDVTKAIKFANNLGILHQGISSSNIIFYKNHGYLID